MDDLKIPAGAAFQHREFRLYAASRFTASVAGMMVGVAVGWQVYDLTRQPMDLGLVGLAQFLPAFLLSPITGHAADRFDRRTILLGSLALQTLCALALLSVAWDGVVSVVPIYGILVAMAVARAFSGPASQSLVPLLVPAAHFPNAVAWSSSAWQVAIVVGPALGGALYGFGPAWVYGVAVGLLAVASLATARMGVRLRPPQAGGPLLERLSAGLRYVWSQPAILGVISLDLFAVLFGGATALLPIYARDILHVGPLGLGLLRSAPAVGAASMALVLAWKPLRRHAGRRMFVAVALFGLATIGFGLSNSFPLSLLALLVLGAADMVSVFIRHSLVQITTPDAMRGRVSAVNLVFIGASNELGEFESGVTAALWGTVPAVVIGGLGTLAVVGLWAWRFPALRRIDRLDTLDPRA